MMRYMQGVAQTSLRWIGSLPKPLLVVAYAATFAVWLALVASTLDLWQQRQTVLVQRRTAAAQTVFNTTAPAANGAQTNGSAAYLVGDQVHPKTGRMVAAWLPTSFDAAQARASFDANKDVLDEVSPFWYEVRSDGTLRPEDGARDRELVNAAHAAAVLVIPTIHNVNDPEAVPGVLRDDKRRAAHIEAIMNEVRTHNYDGIDIDYEALPTTSRAAFSTFIAELSTALHAEGKLLTVAVHAKDSDYGGLGGFQDWQQIGAVADRVRIMTYDYHWRGSTPGPIAPVYWVQRVAEYARSVVPAYKIQIGIAFYGYNWGPNGQASPQTWTDIQGLIRQHQPYVNVATSDDNGAVEESWFTYRSGAETRTVWFSDRRSLDAKLALVEQQDVAGIAIWRLGNEDPANWNVIRNHLSEHPLVTQRSLNSYLPEH